MSDRAVTKYLRAGQWTVELSAALYVSLYGAFVGVVISLTDSSPLSWINLTELQQVAFATLMLLAGAVHATGVRVNGRWRWSPMLRVAGMALHLGIVATIAIRAPIASSAFYNYAAWTILVFIGVMNALHDARHAWGLHGQTAY